MKKVLLLMAIFFSVVCVSYAGKKDVHHNKQNPRKPSSHFQPSVSRDEMNGWLESYHVTTQAFNEMCGPTLGTLAFKCLGPCSSWGFPDFVIRNGARSVKMRPDDCRRATQAIECHGTAFALAASYDINK